MNRPLSSKVANTVDEMAKEIAKVISYLDSQIFKDHIIICISNSKSYGGLNMVNYVYNKKIFKLFGFDDKYIIFKKSHQAEHLRKKPFGIIGTSIHEVRLRYQTKNKKCLISPDFVCSHRLHFNKELVLYAKSYSKKIKRLRKDKMAFDAHIVEFIYNLNYQHPNMNRDLIISLITCNEKSILEIISKLK